MDDRLLEYIKKELSLGFEKEKIKDVLVRAGHHHDMVEGHINHVLEEGQKLQKKHHHGYAIIGILLIIIILVSLGLIFLFQRDYVKSGDELYKNGKYEESIIEYNKELDNNLDNSLIYLKIGQSKYILALMQNKSPVLLEEAKILFQKAIDLDPENNLAKRRLANIYRHLEDYEIAIELLNQIIRADSGHTQAYNSLGFTYYQMKEYEKAIFYFDTGKNINQFDDETYFGLGQVYLDQGKYNRAYRNYVKAIELNGNRSINYYGLARYYFTVNEYDMAKENIDKCLSLEPIFNPDEVNTLKKEIEKHLED